MNRKFEEYLELIHGEHYHGSKDNMVASYERWLEGLDGNELIDFANQAMEEQKDRLVDAAYRAYGKFYGRDEIKDFLNKI